MNVSQPVGNRVTSMYVRCTECLEPEYEPLDLFKTYFVLVPSFISDGGDGMSIFIEDTLSTIDTGKSPLIILVPPPSTPLSFLSYLPPIHGTPVSLAYKKGKVIAQCGNEPCNNNCCKIYVLATGDRLGILHS